MSGGRNGAERDPAIEWLRRELRGLGEEIRREFASEALRCGPFVLLRMIATGALAEVYAAARAEEAEAVARFAVKVIRPGVDGREALGRFRREAELLARVRHPGVIGLVDCGLTADGRPWIAMPLVRGMPITLACDDARRPTAVRAQRCAEALDAVAAAHGARVIHRDLKPSNILKASLEEPGMASIQVIDFGTARALGGGNGDLTPAGVAHRLGTPDYMPPEQWRDGVAACDERSDIFAMGVVLGELLAGVLPRAAPAGRTTGAGGSGAPSRKRVAPAAAVAPSAALRALVAADPDAARRVADQRGLDSVEPLLACLEAHFDELCLRATAEDPAHRPTSAAEFAVLVREAAARASR